MTDKEIYPPLENITLEQAYEDYAKAAEEMKDTLLNEITKLREQLEHLQGEREALLEDIQVSSNQVIEQQAEIENLKKWVASKDIIIERLRECVKEAYEDAIKDFVVRCKDCCYANDHASICHYGVGRDVKPDHYCGYGERRCE